jgi:hypothetical protein
MSRSLITLIGLVWVSTMLVGISLGASGDQRAAIDGVVTLTTTDGEVLAAPGVRLTLNCAAEAVSSTEVSDEQGEFRFADVPADVCSITTDLQGFTTVAVEVDTTTGGIADLELHLETKPIFSGLTLTGEAPNLRRLSRTPRRCGPEPKSLRSTASTCGC